MPLKHLVFCAVIVHFNVTVFKQYYSFCYHTVCIGIWLVYLGNIHIISFHSNQLYNGKHFLFGCFVLCFGLHSKQKVL